MSAAGDAGPESGSTPDLLRVCVARREDEALWRELLARIVPKIRGAIRATLRRAAARGAHPKFDDRCLAGSEQDLLQDVIVRLMNRECALLKRFRGNTEDELSAYLAVIARSVVLDAARRNACYMRHLRMLGDSADHTPVASAEDPLMIREGIELMKGTFEAEPVRSIIRNRLILRLHFLHGLSAAQISRIGSLNLSKDGVQKIVMRAKKRARVMAVGRSAAVAARRTR